MNISKDAVTTLFLCILCISVGYFFGADKPVEVQTVEVERIIWNNHTDTIIETIVETVEVPSPFPVYVNSTEKIYIPTPIPLKDFESKSKLVLFMLTDDTDELEYSSDFDCDDFVYRTIKNAELLGYRINFFYENNGDGTAHAKCIAYVQKEARYIIWEPQNDHIYAEWSSTVGG